MDGTLRSPTLTELKLSDDLMFVIHYLPIKSDGLALHFGFFSMCALLGLSSSQSGVKQSGVALIRDEEEDKNRDGDEV